MNKKDILKQIEDDIVKEATNKKEEIEKDALDTDYVQQDPIPENDDISYELDELPGIGETIKTKLNALGIHIIPDLAVANATELFEFLGSSGAKYSQDFCTNLVILSNQYMQDKGLLDKPLVSSEVLLEKDKIRKRFSTGTAGFDDFLGGGGIESRAITEFWGMFGSGKTQICFSTAVVAASQGRKVLYIDTEDTYRAERIDIIAKEKELDPSTVHKNIQVIKASSASMLQMYMKNLREYIRKHGFELIIIDSIIALHRNEFIGRGNLAPRQQSLNAMLGKLIRIAEVNDIGIIITNQAIDDPTGQFATQKATGGNIINHASTHRIHLTKRKLDAKGKKVGAIATMEDSPRYARTQCMIELTPSGIEWRDSSKLD